MAAPTNQRFRVLEFYSGIGGMHWALKESGIQHKIVAAYDVNGVANKIYRHNFPETTVIDRSIEVVSAAQFEDVDMVLMSPPCQPYTRVGNQHDLHDVRARSFLHILGLLPRLEKHPSYLLVENVKGFEISESRNKLVDTLMQCNYSYQEFLLTPLQFGIPNSRLRYFLIAKQKPRQFAFHATKEVMRTLPDCCASWLTYRTRAESEIPACHCHGYRGNKHSDDDGCHGNIHSDDDGYCGNKHSNGATPECDTRNTCSGPPSGGNILDETMAMHNCDNNVDGESDTTSHVNSKHKLSDDEVVKPKVSDHSNCKRTKTDDRTNCLVNTNLITSTSKSNSPIEPVAACITDASNKEQANGTVNEFCLQNYGLNLRQSSQESEQYGPCLKLHTFLETTDTDNSHFEHHLLPDKFLKRLVIMDSVNACSCKSTCFTKRYSRYIEGAGSLVQMSRDVDCLIAASKLKDRAVAMKNRDEWGDAEYDVIRRLQLRFFTPREVANILCFPKTFDFPDDVTTRQRYMVLGNSLNVHIVAVLIKLMTCEPDL